MFNKNRFMAQLALNGRTLEDVAKALEINKSTLYRKIQRDGDFTRHEISQMIDYLEIQEPSEIFFA